MKEDLSKFTVKEIEEMINELEDSYAGLLGNDAPLSEMHRVRKKILELQEQLRIRKNNSSD
jgi:hypothetical protein